MELTHSLTSDKKRRCTKCRLKRLNLLAFACFTLKVQTPAMDRRASKNQRSSVSTTETYEVVAGAERQLKLEERTVVPKGDDFALAVATIACMLPLHSATGVPCKGLIQLP